MRVLQFGDSVLPVGAFSFSNGLESAIQSGVVRDVETLGQFVRTATAQASTSDGISLLTAFRAAQSADEATIDRADHASFHRKLNEEQRTMSVRMGRKLAEMSDRTIGPSSATDWLDRIRAGRVPGTYPVGQGLVFQALGLGEVDAFAAQQYGLASMMINASLRLMKIHYLDAQRLLFEVNARAEDDYHRIKALTLDDMAAFAPMFDVLCSVHVHSHVRLFMS
ncbi:urease accessory protein UreF [Tautonia sp. JC769]|uniref:urease accessory protein UreF n=1 Tax=Tautonia sp. JC769 TaxID=3232135 RepID=UPI00345A3237